MKTIAVTHCAFSSNLFHGQVVQIAILQLSDSENKKISPWKDFGINHPQTLRLLSRRGPRSPSTRLSQHCIGPKMTFGHFSNFSRKKFPGLTKEISCTSWMNVGSCHMIFANYNPQSCIKMCRSLFVKPENFFLQIFEECQIVIFGAM